MYYIPAISPGGADPLGPGACAGRAACCLYPNTCCFRSPSRHSGPQVAVRPADPTRLFFRRAILSATSAVEGDKATALHPSIDRPLVAEAEAIRACIRRAHPYGSEAWARATAVRLGLESSLRPREVSAAEKRRRPESPESPRGLRMSPVSLPPRPNGRARACDKGGIMPRRSGSVGAQGSNPPERPGPCLLPSRTIAE